MDNYNINLSVNHYGIPPVVHAVQGDTGRTLVCNITDMEIPAGATAKFFAEKPSGAGIYNNAAISGNTVTVELTNQTLAEVGTTKAQIQVANGDDTVSTFRFNICVEKTYSGDFPESKNESTYLDGVLQQMQAQLDTAIAAANEATNAANTAAGSANSVISAAQEAADAANKAAETVDNIVVDFGNTPITFTQAAARENIASGETVITAFGKISKWFADLGNSAVAAFKRIANNLTTTQDGYVLDARQGKSLSDRIGELNALATSNKSSIVNAINELNGKSIFQISYRVIDDYRAGFHFISGELFQGKGYYFGMEYQYNVSGMTYGAQFLISWVDGVLFRRLFNSSWGDWITITTGRLS